LFLLQYHPPQEEVLRLLAAIRCGSSQPSVAG
jgi:hypothetical protein